MSMHRIPLTDVEESGLRAHGLDIGTPSQLSDAFRQGLKYGQSDSASEIAELKRQLEDDRNLLIGIESELLNVKYTGHYYAGIRTIKQQLAESQAREAKLREALEYKHDAVQSLMTWCIKNINRWSFPQYDHLDYANAKMAEAIALPHDDTALKEYRDAVIDDCLANPAELRKEIAELKRQRDELAAVIGKALHWTSVEGVSLFSRYSMVVDTLRAALAHDDTALKEYRDAVIEECAAICDDLENGNWDYLDGTVLCSAEIRKLKVKP